MSHLPPGVFELMRLGAPKAERRRTRPWQLQSPGALSRRVVLVAVRDLVVRMWVLVRLLLDVELEKNAA